MEVEWSNKKKSQTIELMMTTTLKSGSMKGDESVLHKIKYSNKFMCVYFTFN